MQLLGVASCAEVGCSMTQLPLSELAAHASVSNSSPAPPIKQPNKLASLPIYTWVGLLFQFVFSEQMSALEFLGDLRHFLGSHSTLTDFQYFRFGSDGRIAPPDRYQCNQVSGEQSDGDSHFSSRQEILRRLQEASVLDILASNRFFSLWIFFSS